MRALLVDDHVLFSQGLRFLLQDLDAHLVCVTAHSVAAAVAAPGPFDLILLDHGLPDNQGTEGLTRVRTAHEGATVAILSGETRAGLVQELVDHGAAGFIPKSTDTPTLLKALQTMLAGGVYLPPAALVGHGPSVELPEAVAALSPRQMECLLKLVQGKPNKVIAREMDVADSTVKTHLATAFKALGVNSRSEAVFQAAKLGLLPPGLQRRATDGR
jgi:DNA-binding NarL/FixJ family response regulator